jgi:hypothetical protein
VSDLKSGLEDSFSSRRTSRAQRHTAGDNGLGCAEADDGEKQRDGSEGTHDGEFAGRDARSAVGSKGWEPVFGVVVECKGKAHLLSSIAQARSTRDVMLEITNG